MEKDLFNDIVQSYEQLQERAKQIFYISSRFNIHSYSQGNNITNVNVYPDHTEIESESYCCGETESYYWEFPSLLLLWTDDEVREYFRKEKEKYDEEEKLEKCRREEKRKQELEAREKAELERLLKKYGKGE